MINSSRLYNNSQITSWTDWKIVADYLIPKKFCILIFQSQAIILTLFIPLLQCNNKVNILCLSDALNTE